MKYNSTYISNLARGLRCQGLSLKQNDDTDYFQQMHMH